MPRPKLLVTSTYLVNAMAPKISAKARSLFLAELDNTATGQNLKRKADGEGGTRSEKNARYKNLKLAEWFSTSLQIHQGYQERVAATMPAISQEGPLQHGGPPTETDDMLAALEDSLEITDTQAESQLDASQLTIPGEIAPSQVEEPPTSPTPATYGDKKQEVVHAEAQTSLQAMGLQLQGALAKLLDDQMPAGNLGSNLTAEHMQWIYHYEDNTMQAISQGDPDDVFECLGMLAQEGLVLEDPARHVLLQWVAMADQQLNTVSPSLPTTLTVPLHPAAGQELFEEVENLGCPPRVDNFGGTALPTGQTGNLMPSVPAQVMEANTAEQLWTQAQAATPMAMVVPQTKAIAPAGTSSAALGSNQVHQQQVQFEPIWTSTQHGAAEVATKELSAEIRRAFQGQAGRSLRFVSSVTVTGPLQVAARLQYFLGRQVAPVCVEMLTPPGHWKIPEGDEAYVTTHGNESNVVCHLFTPGVKKSVSIQVATPKDSLSRGGMNRHRVTVQATKPFFENYMVNLVMTLGPLRLDQTAKDAPEVSDFL